MMNDYRETNNEINYFCNVYKEFIKIHIKFSGQISNKSYIIIIRLFGTFIQLSVALYVSTVH